MGKGGARLVTTRRRNFSELTILDGLARMSVPHEDHDGGGLAAGLTEGVVDGADSADGMRTANDRLRQLAKKGRSHVVRARAYFVQLNK